MMKAYQRRLAARTPPPTAFSDALDAFTAAAADGVYQLTADRCCSRSAHDALSASAAMMPATDAFGTAVDPLDPLDNPAQLRARSVRHRILPRFPSTRWSSRIAETKGSPPKRRHLGLRISSSILLILVVAGGGLAFAYTRGFGFPTQQDTLTKLFEAASPPMPQPMSSWPPASTIASVRSSWPSHPQGRHRDNRGAWTPASESKATVKVALKQGGEMTYEVDFVREGLGWVLLDRLRLNVSGDVHASADTDESAAGSTVPILPPDRGSL